MPIETAMILGRVLAQFEDLEHERIRDHVLRLYARRLDPTLLWPEAIDPGPRDWTYSHARP